MQFVLRSTGSLDRMKLNLNTMKSYVLYNNEKPILSFGIMLLVIDHKNGRIYGRKAFNTHAVALDSDKMVAYVQQLPKGMILLAAAHADWTRKCSPQLKKVLVSYTKQNLI